jgi:hypothetical protein
MVLGVVSLVFLFSGLVQNPFFVVPVFAEPPYPCFGDDCEGTHCKNIGPGGGVMECCWEGPAGGQLCQTCIVNDDGSLSGCSNPQPGSKGRPDSSTIAPPPSGVAPPPSTQTCPDNTALDAKGNCAPVTQTPKETPSKDQGTTQPPPSDDNKPSKPKLPKGDILKLQP